MNGMHPPATGDDIQTFVRNRYFYGKLMDVFHFDLEQHYFNEKRWLLNRLVTGYGVICGLNVVLTEDGRNLYVGPGVALDKAGREIVVPVNSALVAIPDAPPPPEKPPASKEEEDECDEQGYAHVCICYDECAGDPEPVHAGDCDVPEPCPPGSIRERYTVCLRPRRAHKIHAVSNIEDLVSSGRLNYEALANYITGNCHEVPHDTCISLANVKLPPAGQPAPEDAIDITVRPIVFTNRLLYELLLALTSNRQRPRY
jgi:hypothetical protein